MPISVLRQTLTPAKVYLIIDSWCIIPCIHSLVLGSDVCHDVLVEELEDEGDAVGEDEVLRHELELVHVVHLEVDGRYL